MMAQSIFKKDYINNDLYLLLFVITEHARFDLLKQLYLFGAAELTNHVSRTEVNLIVL